MQEERFSLGENSNRMATVMPFNTTLKVHIRQFYENENREIKANRIGVTLSVEEFDELVKLIPKVQDLEKIFSDLDPKEKLERYHQDLPADEYLYGPMIDKETRGIEHDNPVSLPSLEHIDDGSQKKRKGKRKCSKENPQNINKKLETESKRESGIFVGHWEKPTELKATEKKNRKCNVKHECIDEVDTVESMKEVERKLWLTHYDMLSEKLMEVIREKCTCCQMNQPNQLGHELSLMSSSEEQVNLCFGEVYKRVMWDEVLDNWYKKVLEMTVNPKESTYKNRLRKWLIESPTIEL